MSRMKTPTEQQLNQERYIIALPTECAEYRTTLSTLFMNTHKHN